MTGATASAAGLTATVVLCLVVAFAETAALWWLALAVWELRALSLDSAEDGLMGRVR